MEQDIVTDAATGQAIVTGCNVPVRAVLERLALASDFAAVFAAFPGLSRSGLNAVVRHAAVAVGREVRYAAPGATAMMVREAAAEYGGAGTVRDALRQANDEYDRAHDELELLRSVRAGLRSVDEGLGYPHEEVMAELYALIPS